MKRLYGFLTFRSYDNLDLHSYRQLLSLFFSEIERNDDKLKFKNKFDCLSSKIYHITLVIIKKQKNNVRK